MAHGGWTWDETLYAGSAPYYPRGRAAYPPEMAAALRDAIGLDGSGRLLDVGCGPGSLTLLLAPHFREAVGVDADAGMLAEARREAGRQGVSNVRWVNLRAEDLPAGLGTFDVATFAQSFHWMDRERVVRIVGAMLTPGGVWVHVGATTHRGIETDGDDLPAPPPPHRRIAELVGAYLGPARRAGLGTVPSEFPGRGEEEIMVEAGFTGPRRTKVAGGWLMHRSADEVVASVFSLSSSTPALFGSRVADFERDLRALLAETAPDGRFCERAREMELVIWSPGRPPPMSRL